MIKHGVKKVRVEGHTDTKGSKDANLKLSQARAESVMTYLVSLGIDRQRIESIGYGDGRPVAPNLTGRGRELNRRVEFIVVEK
jgi:outer membrane protein OmpA-like peptidoglycan-associated protein